jgi:peptide/nickel transport system permease protein
VLPAGYFRGWSDSISSFLANLILAFPIILLFYLLVTPEVNKPVPVDLGLFTIPWSIPIGLAALFFMFPIVFLCTMWFTKYESNKNKLAIYLGVTLVLGLWAYSGLVFDSEGMLYVCQGGARRVVRVDAKGEQQIGRAHV